MKKEIGIFEELALGMFIVICIATIVCLLGIINIFFNNYNYQVPNYIHKSFIYFVNAYAIICGMVWGSSLIRFLYRIILGRIIMKLPKCILYNNKNLVEIHIGHVKKKCKKFYIINLKMLLYCVKNKKNIMFDTCFISEKNIKKYVGNHLKKYEPNRIQRVLNSFWGFIFKTHRNKCKRKYLRYVIYLDNLSDKEIEVLESKIICKLDRLNN
jgi:hypothetical protein